MKAAGKHPAGLKKYITRCYADTPREAHGEMAQLLKETVSQVIADGSEWKIDWDSRPLPLLYTKPRVDVEETRHSQARQSEPPKKRNKANSPTVLDKTSPKTSQSFIHTQDPKGKTKPKQARSNDTNSLNLKALPRFKATPKPAGSVQAMPIGMLEDIGPGMPSSGGMVPLPPGFAGFASNGIPFWGGAMLPTNNKLKKPLQSPQAIPRTMSPVPQTPEELKRSQDRKNRFKNAGPAMYAEHHSLGPVVGTSQELEKRYLRLTGPPNPAHVRPKTTLKKSLKHVMEKWDKERNYGYVSDQLKSIRQDLTVQHIKDGFTVKVYEYNARVALECKDLGEFNQCQTKLRELYDGSDLQYIPASSAEFFAYHIFYLLHTQAADDLSQFLRELESSPCRGEPEIKHALEVVDAAMSQDFPRLFQLYRSAPNMGRMALDMFIHRARVAALAALTKSMKPLVPMHYIRLMLGFEDEESAVAFVTGFLTLEDEKQVPSKVAYPAFETARAAASKRVDIKGQI